MTDSSLAQILRGIPDLARFNGPARDATRRAQDDEPIAATDPIAQRVAECDAALKLAREAVARQDFRGQMDALMSRIDDGRRRLREIAAGAADAPGCREADVVPANVVSLDAYLRRREFHRRGLPDDDEI